MRGVELACRGRRFELADIELPLDLDELVPGDGPWEVEIGFGKGRYLLRRAAAEPGIRMLGIEMAARYFKLVERRIGRRRLDNVLLVLGEALYALSTLVPRQFARVVHVYFPDPWPKDRHHKRRLFDDDTIDLLLAMLEPGGSLCFATDHLDYGESVIELLESHPALAVECLEGWVDGGRTNYEIKYEREGRPIVRLVATLRSEVALVHPRGVNSLVVGARRLSEAATG